MRFQSKAVVFSATSQLRLKKLSLQMTKDRKARVKAFLLVGRLRSVGLLGGVRKFFLIY